MVNTSPNLMDIKPSFHLNPKKAEEYAEIKKQAVIKANQNGEKYRQLKEHVFKEFNTQFTEAYY